MKKIMIVATLATALSGITAVHADDQWRGNGDRGNWQGNGQQGNNGRDDRGNWQNRGNGPDQRDFRGDRNDRNFRGDPDGHWRNKYWSGQRFQAPGQYYRPNGYQVRTWRGGDRLPNGYYRDRRYYVDYRAYRLAPPPRGYQWVRVDNDVILTAVATGVIASVVTGLFY